MKLCRKEEKTKCFRTLLIMWVIFNVSLLSLSFIARSCYLRMDLLLASDSVMINYFLPLLYERIFHMFGWIRVYAHYFFVFCRLEAEPFHI